MINFSDINFYLLKNNPFYYGMLSQSKIIIDPKSKYLAYVAVKNKIEMTLNPIKLAELSIQEQAAIIVHEFQHIFSGHIKQSLQKRPNAISMAAGVEHNDMVTNIAMDCEINARNSGLKDSPNLGINSKGPMRGVYAEDFKLQNGESWAHHFKNLLQNSNIQKQKPQSGEGEGHDHDYFTQSDGNEEYMDHVIANSAKKAKEATRMYGVGNTPHEVEEFLDEVERSKSLPWNLLLRQFMQSLISVKQVSSWKKKNRRFKGKLPGIKKIPRVKLLIGMDESGSVSNEERSKLVNELIAINNTGLVELWIAQFDTEIHSYYKFDGVIPPRRANGCTDFIPVHEKAIEEKFKGLVMLTDGEAYYPNKNEIPYKSLWVMTTDTKAPYGQTVRIK